MFKKLSVIIVFILTICIYYKENSLFLLKTVNYVFDGKSNGYVEKSIKLPFQCEDGYFFNVDKSQVFAIVENLNANLVLKENGENYTSYYFYSSKLYDREIIKNTKVNMHVAVNKDEIIIGFPIIYWAF